MAYCLLALVFAPCLAVAQPGSAADGAAAASAQSFSTNPGPELYRLPGATAQVADDAITVSYAGRSETYVPGLGWLSGLSAGPPVIVAGEVHLEAAALIALGAGLPRLAGVRTSGDAEIRLVLDLPELDPSEIAGLAGRGALAAGDSLEIVLPPLLLPSEPVEDLSGVEFQLSPVPGGTLLRVSGPALTYNYFPLAAPTRFVLDLTPQRELNLPEVDRQLGPGVRYHRFNFRAGSGGSVVHVVSIEPGAGELRVVGESHVPRTVRELASGAAVAINAGYFDTNNFAAIGYLLVDHGLLSLPSRNRASIAFGPNGPAIDRVRASVRLHTPLGLVDLGLEAGDGVGVVSASGVLAGRPDMGVLLVSGDRVLENKIGPRLVPAGTNSYALVYPPENRTLALLDTGDRVLLDTNIEPRSFLGARYAVEAGPLLLKGGVSAYEPGVESFPAGQRILDGLTQQAAVGVTASGRILLVVAETMRAAELVELFQLLGASDAMRLDSGSSTTLVIGGEVMNRSSERRVVSAIIFLPSEPWF